MEATSTVERDSGTGRGRAGAALKPATICERGSE